MVVKYSLMWESFASQASISPSLYDALTEDDMRARCRIDPLVNLTHKAAGLTRSEARRDVPSEITRENVKNRYELPVRWRS